VSANGKGEARIVQANAAGEAVWTHDVPLTYPTMQPNQNQAGGMTYWQTLPLLGADSDDVIVTAQKSNMHSGFTCALNGHDGNLIWRQDKSGKAGHETRGFGGFLCPFAGLPKDDGTEDLVS